jgi:GxxExxY protein
MTKGLSSFPELPTATNRLTYDVIGAAIEVHRHLGPGHLESVYEQALKIELALRDIPFESQISFRALYKGQPVGESQLDLLVAHELVVELKSVDALDHIHRAQLLSYLRVSGFHVGLLINFNSVVLRDSIRRVVWNPYSPESSLSR